MVTALLPVVTERVPFTFRHQDKVPSTSGCYVLTTFEGAILYVGLTTSLNRRFASHREDDEKCGVTPQGGAYWFYFLECPEKDIYRLERSWQNQYSSIHGELPIMNKLASPVL